MAQVKGWTDAIDSPENLEAANENLDWLRGEEEAVRAAERHDLNADTEGEAGEQEFKNLMKHQ